jgi:predicted transcriptional regulator
MTQRTLLLSLKSKFAAAIYDGRKRFEYRRARVRCTTPITALIYETMPVGRVTGAVTVTEVITDGAESLLARLSEGDPLHDDHRRYLSGARNCCALRLERGNRFVEPRLLTSYLGPRARAPQSYCFIEL